MLCVRDVLVGIGDEFATQVQALARLAEKHRRTPALARTLTQAALPSTLGAKFARWLDRPCSTPPNRWPRCWRRCPCRSAARWEPSPRPPNWPAPSTAPSH